MAICIKCNKRDQDHELKMPSKRYEISEGGKKKEVCDGFSSIPKDFFNVDTKLTVDPPKVIAWRKK